jgi:hypothetical protein
MTHEIVTARLGDPLFAAAGNICQRHKPPLILRSPDLLYTVSQDGKLVAFMSVSDNGHLRGSYVDPAYRRQGLYTSILKRIMAERPKQILRSGSLDPSLGIKLRLGFSVVRTHQYKTFRKTDVIYVPGSQAAQRAKEEHDV